LPLQPKPEVVNLKVCAHGGPDYAELRALGLAPEKALDFSVSANPFPPPVQVRESLNTVAVERYPDSETAELRQCLSERLGVAPANILAGNGSVELIRLIALAYFGRGDSVLILAPTFGEYEVAARIVGAGVIRHCVEAEAEFTLKMGKVVDLIRKRRPKGVFICNPNNPTGIYLSREEVITILDSSRDCLFILDEAFVSFVDGSWSSVGLIDRGNVVIVRSMTKDYALAGLRLGYAVAHREVIDILRRVCPPWHVNAVAQQAGAVALRDGGYLEQCKEKIGEAKQFLISGLRQIGFTPVPSRANFFLVRVGDGRRFRASLLSYGILVRDCASFGLPEYVRIAPRTMPECQKLIAAIRALKRDGELDNSI